MTEKENVFSGKEYVFARNGEKVLLRENERIDDLERNGYRIIQSRDGFCFGMDAVLLSGFAQIRAGETVVDLGSGTGIIPILLEAKTEGKHFTGLEIQEEMAMMARRSVACNHLEDRINIVQGDIKEAAELFRPAFFDVITTNPPYMLADHGIRNPDDAKAVARHEILCTLDDILRESMRLMQDKSRFYMIHRPFRLTEIMIKMHEYKIEPKRIRFIHPYIDKEPTMVLIEGVRGAKPRVTVEPPLIIFDRHGTQEE